MGRYGVHEESRAAAGGRRSGFVVAAPVTQTKGIAEREAELALIEHHRQGVRQITIGADKAYAVAAFVETLRARSATPHTAFNGHVTKSGMRRRTAIDGSATRQFGYALFQCFRKWIEEPFGCIETLAVLRNTRRHGTASTRWMFILTVAAYNLLRISKPVATG